MRTTRSLRSCSSKGQFLLMNSSPNSPLCRRTRRSSFTVPEPKKRVLPVRQPNTLPWDIRMRWPSVEALRPGKRRAIQSSKKNKAVSVIASTRRDVCLHAEVPADTETLPGGRRYSTQAWQSDKVVARAKPVAISRDPSLRSGQGLLRITRNDNFFYS